MISLAAIETAMYEAMRFAATRLPPDIAAAMNRVQLEETDPLAKMHIAASVQNFQQAADGNGLICGDTGYPLFFVTAGLDEQIEGGFDALWTAARSATARLTKNSFLRPNMVDPLTRANPGDNVGPGMPKVELKFSSDVNGLHIVAAPKGGGSEIFGTFYRMLFPSDGEAGIMRFVLDSIQAGCYAGKICPPAIIGVGIGGTADLCMKLAKEAAVLPPIGRRNADLRVAEMEEKLLAATRQLGIGPMGVRGINAVLDLHISTAVTHTAALPVAVNAQCLIGRRWAASIDRANGITYSGEAP